MDQNFVMGPEEVHITLVHGTFARGAAWVKEGSDLRRHLINHFKSPIVFHEFYWSGLPSHLARHLASKNLRRDLLRYTRDKPSGRHLVIAHSHGGNIALYALRDPEIADKIDGVVALSTPFLVPRPRELSYFGKLSLASSAVAVGGIILAAMHLQFGWLLWPEIAGGLADSTWYHALAARISRFVLWLLLIGLASVIALAFVELRNWFRDTLSLPDVRPERLLIVRGPGDEINQLLIVFQALSALEHFHG